MKKDIGINDQKIVIRKTGGALQMHIECEEGTDRVTRLFLLGTAAGCIAADILKKVPEDRRPPLDTAADTIIRHIEHWLQRGRTASFYGKEAEFLAALEGLK